ncbi:MAG: MFS transporter [Planctomycetaceae bacterium]
MAEHSSADGVESNHSTGSVQAERPGIVLTSRTQTPGGVAPQNLVDRASHPIFVMSYLANLAIVTANAATFVFADWVAWLAAGGQTGVPYQEELPGRVIQYGVLAALTVRIFLGGAIDRFGVRRVWLTMCGLAIAGLSIFATLTALTPLLYVGRILYAVGLAGMFTSGMFHIQWSVAEHRRTEFIALLGSSGFVGMILGPQLADLLRWWSDGQAVFFPRVFTMTVLLMSSYMVFIVLITRGMPRPSGQSARPTLLKLMRRYWPGTVMLVSMAMGVVFTVPSLYLVRFNQHEHFGGISTYWTTYALTAFAFRIRTASLSQHVGRYRLILFGLLAQGLGLWAIIFVTSWWHLLFSAVLCGLGHALLFPSIVSLGSGTFPPQYRGSGTNLTLGFLDLGSGLSAPLLGRIIDSHHSSTTGFRWMFFAAGAVPVAVAALWFVLNGGATDVEASSTNAE